MTISDSVITGNRAAPVRTLPFGRPCPDGHPCPIAWALGGGIDSWGLLTLVNTKVSDNTTGATAGLPGIASDSDGAGIFSTQGSLTVTGSTVSGNRSIAAEPNGQNVGDSPLDHPRQHHFRDRLTDLLATNADSGSDGSAVEADGGGYQQHAHHR